MGVRGRVAYLCFIFSIYRLYSLRILKSTFFFLNLFRTIFGDPGSCAFTFCMLLLFLDKAKNEIEGMGGL